MQKLLQTLLKNIISVTKIDFNYRQDGIVEEGSFRRFLVSVHNCACFIIVN